MGINYVLKVKELSGKIPQKPYIMHNGYSIDIGPTTLELLAKVYYNRLITKHKFSIQENANLSYKPAFNVVIDPASGNIYRPKKLRRAEISKFEKLLVSYFNIE